MPTPFSPADIRHLHLALADAASGQPLQWWHLELAASLPAALPGWRARTMVWLLGFMGVNRLAPVLAALGMPGMRPYRLSGLPASRELALHAALTALVVLGVLVGLDTLNATRQLMLILLGVLGGLLVAGWRWQTASGRRQQTLLVQASITEALVSSENALGLSALMVAAGDRMDQARAQCLGMLADPDQVSEAQLARLGLQSPALIWVRLYAIEAGMVWLGGIALVAWPCWLTPAPWQMVPAALGLLLLHFVLDGESQRWWRAGMRNVLIALSCLGLSWLLHWL
ncbi:hypothetical protein [Chitinimonas sp. BJYL2]|uniref:hypothetical protein n=1 Tax=Chitinimonas sp. BJYL2 TaxID=2976696 RepID=UPI0022B4F16A|nr:hypothetical protein [Chitinimonas sp. BJYL2]